MIVILRQSVRNMSRVFSLTGITLSSFEDTSSITFSGYIKKHLSSIGTSGVALMVATYIYVHRTRFNEFVMGVPYLIHALTLLTGFFTFIKMRKKMDYLLQRINENIFTYTQECQIHVKYSWLCSETNTQKIHFYLFLSQFIVFLVCCHPLYDHYILHKTKSLVYPGWTPWDPEEYFMATFLVQVGAGLCYFWLICVIQLFILFMTIEFSRQNTRLCAALTSIHLRTESTVMAQTMHINGGDKNKQNESMMNYLMAVEFENNIKQCIRHHQMLMELFRIFEYWFTILFGCELLGDSISFAILFYNFFQTSTEVAYVPLLSSTYVFITSLFTRCIVGEIFSEMNEKIVTVLFYEVRWFEQSLSNKRLLSIFHSQVRRPMDLFAFSIFKASFFTFSSLMRTSYSYLNILKASFSSKH